MPATTNKQAAKESRVEPEYSLSEVTVNRRSFLRAALTGAAAAISLDGESLFAGQAAGKEEGKAAKGRSAAQSPDWKKPWEEKIATALLQKHAAAFMKTYARYEEARKILGELEATKSAGAEGTKAKLQGMVNSGRDGSEAAVLLLSSWYDWPEVLYAAARYTGNKLSVSQTVEVPALKKGKGAVELDAEQGKDQKVTLLDAARAAGRFAVGHIERNKGQLSGFRKLSGGIVEYWRDMTEAAAKARNPNERKAFLDEAERAKKAVISIAKNGPFQHGVALAVQNGIDGGSQGPGDLVIISREMAYALQNFLGERTVLAKKGEKIPPPNQVEQYKNEVLKHCELWRDGKATFTKPFMFALSCHALLAYLDHPNMNVPAAERKRVIEVIRSTFDALWKSHWDDSAKGFKYGTGNLDRIGEAGTDVQSDELDDTNLYFVPIAEFLHRETQKKESSYREKADLLAAAALGTLPDHNEGAWFGGQKQCNQQYHPTLFQALERRGFKHGE